MRSKEAEPRPWWSAPGVGVLAGNTMVGKDVAMLVHLATSPSPAISRDSRSNFFRVPVTLAVVPDLLIPRWVEKAASSGVELRDVLTFVYASEVRRGNAWRNIHRKIHDGSGAKRLVLMSAAAFNAYVQLGRQQAKAASTLDPLVMPSSVEELLDAQQTVERLGWPVVLDRLVFDHPEALALSRVAESRQLPAHEFSWVILSTGWGREDPLDVFLHRRANQRPDIVERLVTRRRLDTSVVWCTPRRHGEDDSLPLRFHNTGFSWEMVNDVAARGGGEQQRHAAYGWNVQDVLAALEAGDCARATALCGVTTMDDRDRSAGALGTAVRAALAGSSEACVAEAVKRAENDDVCPIGMEDEAVRLKSVTVGCCQNVFDYANLVVGLAKRDMACPLCARNIMPSDVVVVLPSSHEPAESTSFITPLVRSCGLLQPTSTGDTRRDIIEIVVSETRSVLAAAEHHRVLIMFDFAASPAMALERGIVDGTGGKRLYSARLKTLWNRIAQFRAGDPACRVLVGKKATGEVGLDLGDASHVFVVVSDINWTRHHMDRYFSQLVASARAGDASRSVMLRSFVIDRQ